MKTAWILQVVIDLQDIVTEGVNLDGQGTNATRVSACMRVAFCTITNAIF